MRSSLTRFLPAAALALLPFTAAAPAAEAKVTIAFYSHELGNDFPHAFVKLEGTLEADGRPVDENYGYTAKNISPAILLGNVKGGIDIAKPFYIRHSKRHFAFEISDAQYRAVVARVAQWRDMPGKAYNMNKRNCVHFVADIAYMLGLSVNRQSQFYKRPRSFLLEVLGLNPGVK